MTAPAVVGLAERGAADRGGVLREIVRTPAALIPLVG